MRRPVLVHEPDRARIFVVAFVVILLLAGGGSSMARAQETEPDSANDGRGSDAAETKATERSLASSNLKSGRAEIELFNAPGLSRGVDAIIAEIRKREVGLSSREAQIDERERAVAALESRIEERAMELDRIRQEVEDRIASWSSQGSDRVAQLADVYASMPPEKAGRLLDKLDLDLAVSVVRGMKKKSSAGVLAAMRPERALMLSRRMLKPLDPTTDAPASPGP